MVILLFINLFLYMSGANKMEMGTESSSSDFNFSGMILEEEFNDNKLGWTEESTDFHVFDITEGKYFISSIDTGSSRSSTNCIYEKFLYDLPQQYEISSSLTLLDHQFTKAHYGIRLVAASVEYAFEIYANGKVQVREYDTNKDSYEKLISQEIELPEGQPVEISIRIRESEFEFLVNGQSVGAGKFRTETSSWRDLRLYTSTSSSMVVDYLRIK